MRSVCSIGILLAAFAGVAGCANSEVEQQLAGANAQFSSVSEDPAVLRNAPKDVQRASESLERARRFSHYLGSAEDVSHYVYLSRRYSEIARQHSGHLENQERVSRLAMERERLRQMLQQVRLTDAQQEGSWLEDQLISLAVAETDRGLVMTLGDVLFKPASAELSVSASRTLLKLVHFLQLNPRRTVRIEGYTDNRGDATENLALSLSRAQAVATFLQELGIHAERMDVQGFGEQFRVAENASARGRAQNRRVEIVFSDESGRLATPR